MTFQICRYEHLSSINVTNKYIKFIYCPKSVFELTKQLTFKGLSYNHFLGMMFIFKRDSGTHKIPKYNKQ